MTALLSDAALGYARKGYRVFPCAPAGKHPITRSGLHDATTDAGLIAAWWEQTPKANIAVAVDRRFFVVDLDPRHGGIDNFARLTAEHAPFATVVVRTPRGGQHLWFALPPGAPKIANSAGRIAPGVDVRGVGGYVLVPPSRTTDGVYEFVDVPIFDIAPFWLLRLVAKPKPPIRRRTRTGRLSPGSGGTAYGLARLRGVTDHVRQAREGCRNDRLFWAACRAAESIADGDLDARVAEDALITAALETGLTLDEIAATVASAMTRAGTQDAA